MNKSNHNLTVNSIAYADTATSNNPQIRAWDYTYKLLANQVSKPRSDFFEIAPGDTLNVFNGVRASAISGTTEFDLTTPFPMDQQKYRLSWNGNGTAPLFRSDRFLGVDVTTEITTTQNGPLTTYTSTAGTLLDTSLVNVGDILFIGPDSGLSLGNQGTFVILGKDATSVTVTNQLGAGEVGVIVTPDQFIAFSNSSANRVAIGDRLVISAGFSPASFGTYTVTAVTPSYLEFSVVAPGGLPLESGIIPGAAGLTVYGSAKSFIMIAAQGKCIAQCNGSSDSTQVIEPIEDNNPQRPGLYLKQGTVYSLNIVNQSLNPICVTVTSAE